MCQIITIYLTETKVMAEKLLLQWNLELAVLQIHVELHFKLNTLINSRNFNLSVSVR